ncbi:MAG: NAD(FAD)-utilizing dehydrogenase [Clostridiales Family XIII bacterium]|jgi:uncharacterized FAD-dependent dehydrogenase|nr:NAD(FAD)-utilizing dehydrogenase [Clostridiales Family XIII bacterium]
MPHINEIKLRPGEDISVIPDRIIEKLGLDKNSWCVTNRKITRKSIDARNKRRIRFVYAVQFDLEEMGDEQGKTSPALERLQREESPKPSYTLPKAVAASPPMRPVVAGFGPCGIFAAYALAKAGLRPIVLERGRPVEERSRHVAAFWKDGILNENSNVFFGEGGAGTFSDGKLTTGIGDIRKAFICETFAEAGGGEELLYLSRPHLGTDILRTVIRNLRNAVLDAGGDIRFGCKLAGIGTDMHGRLKTVVTENVDRETASRDFDEIETDRLVIAIGHSARDTLRILHGHGIAMEQKPFSMGIRIEHPQQLINESQYGRDFESIYGMSYRDAELPAAEYKLSHRCADGRGVYTFCMCPGGQVIAAASESQGICTNGMSERARAGAYANSAVLVDVRPEDFGSDHPLAGFALQREIESRAFAISAANDSVHGYLPLTETLAIFGGSDSALAQCLPEFIARDIREALPVFARRLAGFDAADTRIYGPETRSSSPVRIPRDAAMQSNIRGLYPCGEGAGFAGGIMSAAVDGLKVAEQIIADLA